MNVIELSKDQLYELKSKVFYMSMEELEEFCDYLDDEIVLEWEKAQFINDISNKTIYKLFDGIDFVNDDFWCSCNYQNMKDIDILILDGCTYKEAQDLLKNGSIVFKYFDKYFDFYMEEWGIDEEKKKEYKRMIVDKIPMEDWGIVEAEGKTYYIMYVL